MARTIARICAVWVIALLAAAAPAAAEKRVALVIGNGSYQVGPLANPVNDATAVAKLLEGLGFGPVIVKTNLGRLQMQEALQELGQAAVGAEVALVFYAGHGTENAGVNYLIPVDAQLARAADLKLQAFSLDAVVDQMAGASRLRLVILDACRNNIFPLAGSQRAQTRGLARIEPEDNTLVAYAAKAGTTSDDGSSSNSPFTLALLKHLPTPGLDVRLMLGQVRDDVAKATGGVQQPHVYGTLGGQQIYIGPASAAAPGAPSATDAELSRLKAENEALRKKAEQQAMLAPPSKPEPAAIAPGTAFRDCADCPEMVVVPAGSFTMGSSRSEIAALTKQYGDFFKDEGPQRTVTIAKPFAVGKYEVTFGEWDACVSAGGCEHKPDDFGWGRGKRPVINVSWDDAMAYVAWLSRKSGKPYRFLSEAQWEYAARAGTTTPFSTGTTITTDQANFDGNFTHGGSAKGIHREKAIDVGSFKPNAFGLFDMHGNVYEWVADCYQDSYRGSPTDGSAMTSGDCSLRVIRGGSWDNGPGNLRSAIRISHSSYYGRDQTLGFRVARTM